MPERLDAIDYEAFARDLRALRAEIEAGLGARGFWHLRKMERWGRLCTIAGYATAWMAPNPISACLLSQGNLARWTIVMHHVEHRAFDRLPGVPERYTARRFARGWRRAVDWLDWILPEAWRVEHNVLHHHRTGETADPDLVEESARMLREAPVPRWAKYALVALSACTWKLTYYAPNTFQCLSARRRRAPAGPSEERSVDAFNPLHAEGRAFWRRCVLPYAIARFGLIPALFLPLGPAAVASVLANSAAAEVLTNVHAFLLIVPNHAGADLCRFSGPPTDQAEFFVRQVASTANYHGGSDLADFLQGFLNYQIEHHLFPDLPPLAYREMKPRVKALCEKHGIPYIEESVIRRAAKLVDVLVGKASLRRAETLSKAERASVRAPLDSGALARAREGLVGGSAPAA